MRLILLATILLTAHSPANSHGLSPTRLEAPSGVPYIAYRFTAANLYPHAEEFEVECFKGNVESHYPCKAIPHNFWIPTKGTRSFKVQIAPDEDAVYLVCTTQVTESMLNTRVCARFGVGVSPSPERGGKRNAAAGTAVSRRSGQNTSR